MTQGFDYSDPEDGQNAPPPDYNNAPPPNKENWDAPPPNEDPNDPKKYQNATQPPQPGEYQEPVKGYPVNPNQSDRQADNFIQLILLILGLLIFAVTSVVGMFLPFCDGSKKPMGQVDFVCWILNIILGSVITFGIALIPWLIIFAVQYNGGRRFY